MAGAKGCNTPWVLRRRRGLEGQSPALGCSPAPQSGAPALPRLLPALGLHALPMKGEEQPLLCHRRGNR